MSRNLKVDRAIGLYWENQFCEMVKSLGKSYTPMQVNLSTAASAFNSKRRYTLPDIALWTFPGEYHEIKHKQPFDKFKKHGPVYGLEKYRYDALVWFANETQQKVAYTIHYYKESKFDSINNTQDWLTVDILDLNEKWCHVQYSPTYVNGQIALKEVYYWDENLWQPFLSNEVRVPIIDSSQKPYLIVQKLLREFQHIDKSSAEILAILFSDIAYHKYLQELNIKIGEAFRILKQKEIANNANT